MECSVHFFRGSWWIRRCHLIKPLLSGKQNKYAIKHTNPILSQKMGLDSSLESRHSKDHLRFELQLSIFQYNVNSLDQTTNVRISKLRKKILVKKPILTKKCLFFFFLLRNIRESVLISCDILKTIRCTRKTLNLAQNLNKTEKFRWQNAFKTIYNFANKFH